MNEALVEIKNLTKTFSPQFPDALHNISATIPHGKIVGLVGPDGAGKTTLIRLIASLLLPTKGNISVGGKDSVLAAESIHEMTGYMPQKFGLYEDLTVIQNLNLYADLRDVIGDLRQQTFEKLLDFTGLDPFQNRLARDLSGGMKQKLGLACALVKKPRLLILDEPSVGVDPISRCDLWKMVFALISEGISVVWSTAYLDEAEKCDFILLLNKGELLYHGTPDQITEKVKEHVFLIGSHGKNRRKLLQAVLLQKNVIDAVIQGKDVRVVVTKPPFDMSALPDSTGCTIDATAPRFEDAFIEILGGGPGGGSLLADRWSPVTTASKSVIEAINLTKRFGTFTAVDQISFSVQKGEIFGLLGPNGAGKSTIFKMLCGLLKVSEGEALINSVPLQKAPSQVRSQVGYMAQKFSLYSGLTVLQNLDFFSGIYNLRGKKKREIMDEMIEVFDLKNYINTPPDLLPLGFKQRLSLACATMHSPPLLFLDEPTSGVDPITRREFWNHINGIVEKGVTILVTTHFMDEAEYCDRIALVYQGKLINIDAPNALKEKCQTKENSNPTLEEAFIKLIEEYDGHS